VLKPDFVQDSQWKYILRQCIENNCNPYLIVAIGIHETGWGALGWGRKGFILGVGCFSENNADYNFQGFENQIKWAASQLGKFFWFSSYGFRIADICFEDLEAWRP